MIAKLVASWNESETADGVLPFDRSFAQGTAAGTGVAAEERGAVLLLHGAGATPADWLELAALLEGDGHLVLAPLLPAHGRGSRALGRLRFVDLHARALESFDALARESSSVSVVAQSMGAIVALRLAAERPVARFAALAPALRPTVGRRALALVPLALRSPSEALAMLRWQWEARRGIAAATPLVERLTCPLLVLHSEDDDSVEFEGGREFHALARSASKRFVALQGQGHVLTAAPARGERIFPEIRSFLNGGA